MSDGEMTPVTLQWLLRNLMDPAKLRHLPG